jgi:MFS family permease
MKFSESMHLKLLMRAFQYRNYRLFFAGQGISLIGTWTQQVAISWLVYRLTGSAFLLGVVAFCNQIPTFFLAPFAGVIADRLNRQQLLLWTQALSMFQAMVLAALVLTDTVRTWQIVGLSIFIGIVNAFDIPTRQSFVVEMVDKKEDLGNAIALNSAMFNGARFIGPSVAGILISTLGEGICFLLNGISYVAVLMALAAIKARPRKDREGKSHFLRELREGVAYAYNFKPIMAILSLLAVFSLAGSPYVVLMPVYAKDVLQGSARTFGFLMSATGIGALTSTMYLASRKSVLGLGGVIPMAAGLCGVGIAAFAVSRNFTLSLVFLFVAGFGMMTQIASSNTIVQTIVDEDKRGRIMSLYAMSLLGMMPFGSLLAGAVAGKIGVQNTLLLGAVFCIIGSLIFASKLRQLRELVRPIYVRMGIIPERVAGIQTMTETSAGTGKD